MLDEVKEGFMVAALAAVG